MDADSLSGEESSGLKRPLIFGEVLFDHFPDGNRVLGGAPFNVAWNLKGLGFNPLFVSAIGRDTEGDLVVDRMRSWGMDLGGLQRKKEWPTGKVCISIENNEPSYRFAPDQAYDHIDFVESGNCSLLYHGSLALRGATSRATFQRLTSRFYGQRFVDINIRRPHFRSEDLSLILGGATWVKLNAEELQSISGCEVYDHWDVESAVDSLRAKHGNATYFVTRGSSGAIVVDENDVQEFASPPTAGAFRDSVGAGDAFSAAIIGGLLLGKPTQETLHEAVRLASRICGIQGATSEDRSIYQEQLS